MRRNRQREVNSSVPEREVVFTMENVDSIVHTFPEKLKKFILDDSPTFFDVREVNDFYLNYGQSVTIEMLKSNVNELTLDAYGVSHPEYVEEVEDSMSVHDNNVDESGVFDNF